MADECAAAADESTGAEDGGEPWTCAVCLQAIEPCETALVKGCHHAYCAGCILRWASYAPESKAPWCPQCKAPFNYLYTYRALDGTLHDFPVEESVTLLLRACWFDGAPAAGGDGRGKGKLSADDAAALEEYGDEPYFDDCDEEEDAYFYGLERSGRRARVLVGNRPFGQNGYVASGRSQARPRQTTPSAKGKGKGKAAQEAGPAAAAGGSGGGLAGGASATPKKLSAAAQKRLEKEQEKARKKEQAKANVLARQQRGKQAAA